MTTAREYLVSLNLANPTRGRFSAKAHEALAAAKASGMVFDEPVVVKAAPKAAKPTVSFDAKAAFEAAGVTDKHISMSPREFLSTLNPPLAKMGVRGAMPADGIAVLTYARSIGYSFDTAEPVREPRPVSLIKRVVVKPTVKPAVKPSAPVAETNPKEVRAWAKANGHEVGDRGRIHNDVVTAYLAAGGKAVGERAKPTVSVPQIRVREQNEAWGIIKRPEGVPSYVSEPRLGVTSCAACNKQVAFCSCPNVILPKWAGGGIAVLDKSLVVV